MNWKRLLRLLAKYFNKPMELTKAERLVNLAVSRLGLDFTDDKVLDDEVSCAFAVTTLLNEIDGRIPIIHGTYQLLNYLETSTLFQRVYEPQGGDIVVSATGTSKNNTLVPRGHTGIYQNTTQILSNDSMTGKFIQNYTRDSWRERWYYQGHYPVKLFRFIS